MELSELRRREFPGERVYLAHAAVSPLPMRSARAVAELALASSHHGQFHHLWRDAESGCRRLLAHLVSATADEIAFCPSTSAGLNLVAAGLPWRAGDSVLVLEHDFPSVIYPWLALQARGVEVRKLPAADLDTVAACVDSSTRLVALSTAHYATGAAIDVDAIGAWLRERGILFCVDAIQTLGALPLSVRHVDFLVADAHKWLLGPQGIGVLYVRRDHFSRLEPAQLGWKSVTSSRALRPTAERYEPGSLNALGLAGLYPSLQLLMETGIHAISARVLGLRRRLLESLRECRLLTDPAALPSGIVSFRPLYETPECCHHRLAQAGFVVSLREYQGKKWLRAAPHFYNTEDEIDAFSVIACPRFASRGQHDTRP
jgi:selenocysteine lyase/cysteine desulfurase